MIWGDLIEELGRIDTQISAYRNMNDEIPADDAIIERLVIIVEQITKHDLT